MAIAGTAVSGGCTVLAIPILAAILFPVFAKAREQARQTTCLDNMKQLGLAMRLYSADYEGHLPPAASWNASIGSYVKAGGTGLFTCPSSEDPRAPYKMNRAVGGVSIFALQSPANTISLFDATPGGSVYGGSPDVAARHYSHGQDAATFGFADGHVHVAPPAELRGAPWNPLLIAPKRPGKP
jgi:prepilin-type processing-associated H-X9-DG protein